MEKIKVAFLCPIAEHVDPRVFQSALAMVSYASAHGLEVTQVGVTERTLIHQARNQLAIGFKATECDWAFWMDADMICPPETIVRLYETAKKVDTKFMTGLYFQRIGDHFPVLWRKEPELMDGKKVQFDEKTRKDPKGAYLHHFILPTGKEPVKADVAGFGCILMHRELMDKVPYPYFKTLSDDCSEDFYFCIQAKEAGYQLWVDPSLDIYHVGRPQLIGKKDCKVKEEQVKEIRA